MPSVIVETWTVAKKRRLLERWSVPIEPGTPGVDGDAVTLRDVIARIVRREVANFDRRQDARRFARMLSSREIEVRAASGRVDPGGHPRSAPVDEEEAVAAVMGAFEDGLLMVLLDDVEQRELDTPIHLTDDSRLAFLRLTFLAGA
jgi:hypothetical protein